MLQSGTFTCAVHAQARNIENRVGSGLACGVKPKRFEITCSTDLGGRVMARALAWPFWRKPRPQFFAILGPRVALAAPLPRAAMASFNVDGIRVLEGGFAGATFR